MANPLITDEQMAQLLANGKASAAEPGGIDHQPVVKLFTPDGSGTWLISEIDPEEPDYAFCLADLGMGCPEMGGVLISELKALRGKLGLPVERDLHFKARAPLGEYASIASRLGHLTTGVIHQQMA